MSELFSVTGFDPLLLVAALSAVFALGATMVALCAVWIAASGARRNRELHAQLMELQTEFHNRLKIVDRCSIGIGESVARLESRLNQSITQQQSLEQGDFSRIAHNQLSKLVGMGATADDLVHNCGLSKAEADLLLLLNDASRNPRAEVSEH